MPTAKPAATGDVAALLAHLEDLAAQSAELAELMPLVAALFGRLETLEHDFARQLQREKLAAMHALAYGASHEINNPLANIAARAQSLLLDEKDPQRRRSLATMNAQAFRAHEMIADLMLFAKPPAPRIKSVNLAALADRAIAELAAEAQDQGTELERERGGTRSLTVNADEVQLGVAVRALVQNALEALGRGGRITVRIERVRRLAMVHVADNGPGLTDEAQRHLFDPFYSGREAGRGLGLGLSKVWRIMELHGGQVFVNSRRGEGTTVTLALPAA